MEKGYEEGCIRGQDLKPGPKKAGFFYWKNSPMVVSLRKMISVNRFAGLCKETICGWRRLV